MQLKDLKGVGEVTLKNLKEAKIESLEDLLLTYPKTYENYELTKLSSLLDSEIVTIKGTIVSKPTINYYQKIDVVSFYFLSNYKKVKIIAFRRAYLSKSLKEADELIIKGKYNYKKNEIVASTISNAKSHKNIKPVYKIDNILDVNISKIIKEAIKQNNFTFEENLQESIIKKYNFINKQTLIKYIHNPKNTNELKEAIKRIKYEEAYAFQKDLLTKINKPYKRKPKNYDLELVKKLIEEIPFELTKDQKNAVNDCFSDFKADVTSYRLIQGDVGSGKTIVAAIAIYGAITAGDQVALMAPTEMLAVQHYNYFKTLFKDLVNIELLTSDTKNKELLYDNLKNNKTNLVIGTHALIEKGVGFNNLGLIVIDEQHKFGVRTRDNLIKKNNLADLIYLTATPIPRTLAISLFGDAKISTIKEKPKNRKPVITRYINDNDDLTIYNEVMKTLSRNEKIYIVAPAIESLHAKYNINNLYEKYREHFKDEEIYVLHGSMDSKQQNITINNFINSKKAILIATTMIEVGIDIKDATLILIYAANYFGLSQIHQLRGRVGRSDLISKCFLISDDEDNERLKILEKISDGFLLSKYDLKLRGPGILMGLEQTGFPKFLYLDFIEDYEILKNARNDLIKA